MPGQRANCTFGPGNSHAIAGSHPEQVNFELSEGPGGLRPALTAARCTEPSRGDGEVVVDR